jgi:hypothetical protein
MSQFVRDKKSLNAQCYGDASCCLWDMKCIFIGLQNLASNDYRLKQKDDEDLLMIWTLYVEFKT